MRDDSRTNGAILIRDPATEAFTRTARSVSNVARVDWLFSYHPTPGTSELAPKDSNLHSRIQSPVSCRWTRGQQPHVMPI